MERSTGQEGGDYDPGGNELARFAQYTFNENWVATPSLGDKKSTKHSV